MAIEIQDIEALLFHFDRSAWRELHVRSGGLEVYAARSGAEGRNPMLLPRSVEAIAATPPTVEQGSPQQVEITAPHLGTVRPAVAAGSVVEAETVVVHLELLGERREVRAGRAGKIEALTAGDGDLVEFGQVLMVLDPAA